MAAGVAGQVHRLHVDAAEVPHVPVGESVGVGARRVVDSSTTCLLNAARASPSSPNTSIRPSMLRAPGRSAWWMCTRASLKNPFPAR